MPISHFPSLEGVYDNLRINGQGDLIRVVTLALGSWWENRDFEMKTINFRDDEYEALSHRWTGTEYQAMAINSVFIHDAMSNLHSALQRIRASITVEYQGARAKRVMVWLGEGTPESDMAVFLL